MDELKEETVEVEEEKTEEECQCYSVEPPEEPWKSTFVFGTYDCGLCGRRITKE